MTKNNKKGAKLSNAVAYVRVSKGDSKVGLKNQFDSVCEYATTKGYEIKKYFVDAEHSGADDRNSIKEIIKESKKRNWKYLLVGSLDRLTRSPISYERLKMVLESNGVEIICASGANDKLGRGIEMIFAQYADSINKLK